MADRFHLVVLGTAIGLLVVISIGTGTTAGEPDADELVEKAVDSLENEPIEAVHTQTITQPDSEVTQTVAIHRDSSQGGYLEILESNGEARQTQTVVDESSVWQQVQDSGNTVRYHGMDEFWFDEFRTLGASPKEVLTHYRNEYRGISEVDGRQTHVVELVPPKETTAELSLDIDTGSADYDVSLHEATEEEWYLSRETWWIDAETYYPIKQTVQWTDEEGNVISTATREFEELTIGDDVEETDPEAGSSKSERATDTELEPPRAVDSKDRIRPSSGAVEPKRIDPKLFSHHQAANVTLPFDLPTVEVPPGYTLEQITVESYNDTHAVVLLYEEEETGAPLSVQISHGTASLFHSNLQIHRESVSGFDGEIVITDTGTEIVRQCDDFTYRVRGPPAAETLIEVTESIEC